VTKQPKVFWVGLSIYVASFFLPSIEGTVVRSGPALEFHCAFYSISLGLSETANALRSNGSALAGPSAPFSLLASGMINILFVVVVGLTLSGRLGRRQIIFLTCLLVLLFPFCWVVFFEEKLHPLVGYFLWMAGMLTVLFTGKVALRNANALPRTASG
jgi:hypothetical protein